MARKARKNRLAPGASVAATPDESTEEQERLSRAWIKVAVESAEHGIELTQELIKNTTQETGNSFWELVREEFMKLAPKAAKVTADDLCEQWSAIHVSLVEFLVPFTHLWVGPSISSQDAETALERAFTAVQDAFHASHGHEFCHEVTARLLIHHEMWGTILKPLLIPDEDDEPMPSKTTTPGHVEGGIQRPKADEAKDKTMKSSRVEAGVSRPREEESEPARRVRQRLNTAPDSAAAQLARVGDGVDPKEVELMERRLDLDVMTYSEEGLSAEAVEYLHLQRQQILRKAQELAK